MKKPRIVVVATAIMFILIIAIYSLGYLFYVEYTQRLACIDSQNQIILKKHLRLQNSLVKLEMLFDDLKTAGRRQKKEILEKIGVITGEIRNLKDEYAASLDKVKTDIKNLSEIDLGKISVDKSPGE